MSRSEEEHARVMLEVEVGTEFQHYDDGSSPGMPDLRSIDGMHVAEVITSVPAAAREAERHLAPMSGLGLPHCVWVMIPNKILGGGTRQARRSIVADILRWTMNPDCLVHWSKDQFGGPPGLEPDPILALRAYDDGVQVMCVRLCMHREEQSHEIHWSVTHGSSPEDPWSLIERSLGIVDHEQRGGVSALASKLSGASNKHLVIYPFGPPGNLTAALSGYVPPLDQRSPLPPRLNPPLSDIHIWLLYAYGDRHRTEGLHVCDGHWSRFGSDMPQVRSNIVLHETHYERNGLDGN